MERRQQDTAGVNGREVGSGKPVSAGNGKKGEGEKESKGYRQKKYREIPNRCFQKAI